MSPRIDRGNFFKYFYRSARAGSKISISVYLNNLIYIVGQGLCSCRLILHKFRGKGSLKVTDNCRCQNVSRTIKTVHGTVFIYDPSPTVQNVFFIKYKSHCLPEDSKKNFAHITPMCLRRYSAAKKQGAKAPCNNYL